MDITIAETMQVVAETHKHAKENGLGRGKGGTGSLPCSCCKTGTINYSVASVNGHIWGKCTTPNCVSWME